MNDNIFLASVKTLTGLEPALKEELEQLGFTGVEIKTRAVQLETDLAGIYKINYLSRLAIKVYKSLTAFSCPDEDALYRYMKEFQWDTLFDLRQTFAIDASVYRSEINHTKYAALKGKDAIVDYFREKFGSRPNVDVDSPDLRLYLQITDNFCRVWMDSSGDSLHLRGYKTVFGKAPISEVLAAGLLKLSGWDKKMPLIDISCGSGTILTEAAMMARNIPAGYFRESFGFMKWRDYNPSVWRTIREGNIEKIDSKAKVDIFGCDISDWAIDGAETNAKEAMVDDMVELLRIDFRDFIPPEGPGLIISNPPYGERLQLDDLQKFYSDLGSKFKRDFVGYEAWLIVPQEEVPKWIGLKPAKKIRVTNGSIPCNFMKFELYHGSKKASKQE